MPTLTSEKLVHLQELCQKYRIEFLGEIDSSHWPEWHKDTLNGVRDVASIRYNAYATNPAHLGTDPWKMERKSHAMVLVKSADRSRGRNEKIDKKLVNPVVVRERDGLWISTLEAVGLNQIFNFRADDEVNHGPEIGKELGKREHPDRVYGLRKTRNIELLLYDIAAQRPDPEVSTDSGQTGRPFALRFMNPPMNEKGDHQLFPFLVLEAKTGSSDDWHAINMQTAFSIRTFLDSQQQLYSAASALSDWKAKPMVWFFSNKGENWRLCAAYTEDASAERDRVGTTVYRVIDVWHGCITSRDGALQLLLLVDYLFDWARDKYREDIIGALRTVARGESDAASGVYYPDTDIFSTVPLDGVHQPTQVTEDDSNLSSYISAQSPFLALDSPAGVFRHATFVESKYYCLYITRDNVETFLRSATQTRVQPLCRLILGHMSQSILTDPGTLDAIEVEWTGVSRSSGSSYRPQAKEQFHVVFLADKNQYKWFKNAVRGEPPFQIKELSEEEAATRFWTIRTQYRTLRQDIAPRPYGFNNIDNYDGNIDWTRKLDFYSKLNDPFNDIAELAAQWQRFCRYCNAQKRYHPPSQTANRKRKRSEEPDSEETDNSPRDL
ncbi:hypothetical protein TrVFT333_006795 [Trichoderma virens FT-333]|nr:hypothetical protein TrVFT333_006795 [Trichoderma virens FT-333]